MDLAHPFTAVLGDLDGAVLAVLAGTDRPLTGREISRLAGRRSHSGVLSVLTRLSRHGLVDLQEAGRALLYTLNREHLAAPAVDLLTNMRAQLFDRIRAAVAAWAIEPLHLSVFGSAARGDGDVESDIDLFLVRRESIDPEDVAWLEQRAELSERVHQWSGNHAAISEVTERNIVRLRRERPPIVTALRRDAVVLFGPPIHTLLEDA
jgi:predicted nucleotidyltransferase